MSVAASRHEELARSLGRSAHQLRKRLGWTQQDIAERVGVVAEVYGRLERGQMLPSVPTLCRLCQALGVDANTLLGMGEGMQEPRPGDTGEQELPPEVRRLARQWRGLAPRQQALVRHLVRALLRRNGVPGRGPPLSPEGAGAGGRVR